MSSKAKLAAGTKLQIQTVVSPSTYVSIAEILTLGIGGDTIKTPEVTNMDSPANSAGVIFAEFIAATAESGDCDFTYNFIADDAAGQKAFRDAFDGQVHKFYIVIPVANPAVSPIRNFRLVFDGIVSQKDKVDFAIEKQMIGTGKIKPTGGVTLE
jgi:hypothetical protein